MKKYLGFPIVLFVALITIFSVNLSMVNAQSGLSTEATDTFKADKKDIRILREQAQDKMQRLKTNLKTERDQNQMKAKEARITGRERALGKFDKAVEILTNAKNRIVLHIQKIEAIGGIDVTLAKSNVATAEIKIEEAKVKIAEIHVLLSVSIDALSLENKTILRELAQETQTLLKETHRLLRDTIKLLKEILKARRDASVPVSNETNVNINSETNNQ
jgi:hypothetical protein